MNLIASLTLLAAAAALATPASAAKLSLQKTVKLCKAEIAALPSAPKSARLDDYETRFGETDATLVFKVRSPDGRMNKLLCHIDRETNAATLTYKFPPPETNATTDATRSAGASPSPAN